MTPKEFLETISRTPPDKIDLETGTGYMVIAPKNFGLLGNLMLSPTQFPPQLVKLLPYDGPYDFETIRKEVIHGVEVEFRDGPMHLVVGAPENPRGYPYLRIAGDLAVWSNTNSAPF